MTKRRRSTKRSMARSKQRGERRKARVRAKAVKSSQRKWRRSKNLSPGTKRKNDQHYPFN